MNAKQWINQATLLPVEDRLLLVDSLLQSLNHSEIENEKKWVSTAKQRLCELQVDPSKSLSGEAVFKRVWQRF